MVVGIIIVAIQKVLYRSKFDKSEVLWLLGSRYRKNCYECSVFECIWLAQEILFGTINLLFRAVESTA